VAVCGLSDGSLLRDALQLRQRLRYWVKVFPVILRWWRRLSAIWRCYVKDTVTYPKLVVSSRIDRLNTGTWLLLPGVRSSTRSERFCRASVLRCGSLPVSKCSSLSELQMQIETARLSSFGFASGRMDCETGRTRSSSSAAAFLPLLTTCLTCLTYLTH